MRDAEGIAILAGITLTGAALIGQFMMWVICVVAGLTLLWAME